MGHRIGSSWLRLDKRPVSVSLKTNEEDRGVKLMSEVLALLIRWCDIRIKRY
jgi:hypothetical protein